MPQAQVNQCAHLFGEATDSAGLLPNKTGPSAFPQDPATLKKGDQEVRQAREVSEYLMQKIRRRSDQIKKEIQNEVIELDWLCVGAGPQCAAASLMLGKTSQRSLVIESSQLVARNFADKDFFINSTESKSISVHDFPGGVGQLAQYSSQKYAHSSQLAAYIQAQQYAPGVDVLLGTEMISMQMRSKQRIEVTTADGTKFIAKKVLLGTGLGAIGTKVRDVKYKNLFTQEYQQHLANPDTLLDLMSTDSFLIALKNARASQKKLKMPRRIIIIGDGDGSRIALEGLRAGILAKQIELVPNFEITWIGNKLRTADEFIASRQGDDRYLEQILPFFRAGQITGKLGHVEKFEILKDGIFQIETFDKESQSHFVSEASMIIDSTGYISPIPEFLKGLGAKPELRDVLGPLKELNTDSTILGRQAELADGSLLPIYVLGAAAGALGTTAELSPLLNKNQIAIINTVARTSALVAKLLGLPELSQRRGLRMARPQRIESKLIIKDIETRVQQRAVKPASTVPNKIAS